MAKQLKLPWISISFFWAALGILALSMSTLTHAGPRDQARRMHDRLIGTPPSEAVLTQMTEAITQGNPQEAAHLAMKNPTFYNTTLRNWVTPWTNETRTLYAELNDYTATIIGIIRDDIPFNEILSADLIYLGAPGVVPTAYAHVDNRHYAELEQRRVDLSDPTKLISMAQSALPDTQLTPDDTAGVITTRAAAQAFFSAGTNRRMWRFTAINYLCRDMEELKDITRTPDRIRQDVTRSPGGDSSVFLNSCIGCHTGMDALAGAYAYYNFDDQTKRLVFTRNQVQPKHFINNTTFPQGYVTTDDGWINYWRAGPNALLGWRGQQSSGRGAKSLGQEIAASRAFSECQVRKVYAKLCLHEAESTQEKQQIARIADTFETNRYSMKRVFAEVASVCMGQ
jgi:hypothetical protein